MQSHAKSLLPNNIEQAAAELDQSKDEVIQQLLKNHLIQLGDAGNFNAYIALLNVPYLQKNDPDLLQGIFEKLYTFLINKITTEAQNFPQIKADDKLNHSELDTDDNLHITKQILILVRNIEKIRTNPDLVSEIINLGQDKKRLHDLIITIRDQHIYLQEMVLNNQNIFSPNDRTPPLFKTFFTIYCVLAEYANYLIEFAKKNQNLKTKTLLAAASLKVNIPEEIKNYLLGNAILPVIDDMHEKISNTFKRAPLKINHEEIAHTISLFENACKALAQFPHLYQQASLENKPGMFNDKLLALKIHIQNLQKQAQEVKLAQQEDQPIIAEAANSITTLIDTVQPTAFFKLKPSTSPITDQRAIFRLKEKESLASPDSPDSKNAQFDNNSTKNAVESADKLSAHPSLDDSAINETMESIERLKDLTESFLPYSFNSRKSISNRKKQNLTKDVTVPEVYCDLDAQLQELIRKEQESKLEECKKLAGNLELIKKELEMIQSQTLALNMIVSTPQSTIDYIHVNQWIECQESIKELEVKINSVATEKDKFISSTYIDKALQGISEKITACNEILATIKSHCTAFDMRLSNDQLITELAIKQEMKKNQQTRNELSNKHIAMLDKYYSQRKHDYYHYDNIAKIGVFFARCISPDYQTDKKERKAYIEKVKNALIKYAKNGNKEELLQVINTQQFKSRTNDKNSSTYQLTLRYVINQLKQDLGIDIVSNAEPYARPGILPA